jgi:hypothetical protein
MTAFKDCTTEDKWVKLKHHLSLNHSVPKSWVLWLLETTGQERISELEAALSQLRSVVSPFPSEDTERYREEYYACERADAALKGKTDV